MMGGPTPYPSGSTIGPGTPVSSTAPTDTQLLAFNASTGQWTPTTDPGASLPDPVTPAHGGTGATTIGTGGSVPYASGSVAAVAATGSVTFGAMDVGDLGTTFTLNDGVHTATTFEFTAGGGPSPGNVEVSLAGGPATYATSARDAINGVGASLAITASASGSVTSLANDTGGTAGNVAITKTTGAHLTVSGMSGGTALTAATTYGFSAGNASASTVLHAGVLGAPTWSAVDLAVDVTGVLPRANGGTNSSTALASNRIMVSASGKIDEAAALTNGQLLIGSTGAAPVAASVTAGTRMTITPSAGGLSFSIANGAIDNTALANSSVTVNATSPLSTTSAGIALGSSATLSIQASDASHNGYMSSSQASQLAALPTKILSGTATLSAGTVTITAAITASSRIIPSIADANPGAGGLTVGVEAPYASRNVGAGTFVVRANLAAGTINNLDTSVVDWIAVN